MSLNRTTLEALVKHHRKPKSMVQKFLSGGWNPRTWAFRSAPNATPVAPIPLFHKPSRTTAPAPRNQVAEVPSKLSAKASATATVSPSPIPRAVPTSRDTIAAERARCAQIIKAGIASGQINTAAALAFESNLDAAVAISALDAAIGDGADARRNGLRDPIGYHTTASVRPLAPKTTTGEDILRMAKKARGEQ
ncbi:hypothetical protein ACQUFY_16780 [Robbsia andropogonis]|uniref:hypothetical protein n=1 Tax=Robbsia andropogonis TaxID=28092 RepID=UPI003D23FDF3